MIIKKLHRQPINLLLLFLLGIIIRLVLTFIPGFEVDMQAWFSWAARLSTLGFSKFYTPNIWTHYTPGYLYILFILEKIKILFNLGVFWDQTLFKFPGIISDIVSTLLIYKILSGKNRKIAAICAVLYFFNPAVIFNTSIWGQADSFLIMLLLLTYYFANKQLFISSLFMGLAILVKPQALFFVPVLAIFIFTKNGWFKLGLYMLSAAVFCIFLSLPFFPKDPFFGLVKLIIQMGRDYPFSSLNAFNLWQVFGGWKPDASVFLGLSRQIWGIIFFSVIEIIIVTKLFFEKNKADYPLALALSYFNFYLFITRVHERYLLPGLALLLIAAGSRQSLVLLLLYILSSLIHFVNLYYVFVLYYPKFLKINFLFNLTQNNIVFLSLFSIILVAILFFCYMSKKFFEKADINFKKMIKKLTFIKKIRFSENQEIVRVSNAKIYLLIILAFAFLSRFILVWYPKAYVFDEVYHAFTAQEMVKGNAAAWEWWNTPPKGFAYEWTHPPLAKLFMAGGLYLGRFIKIGSDFFWWRLPAVFFGTGVVWAVYLLAKKITNSEKIGLVSAFILSCEGLTLVMSRIGMNDIYFLFFSLFALWFALQKKWFYCAFLWGLSLSCKWTAMYLGVPLFILFAFDNVRRPLGFFKWIGILGIVAAIYIACYGFFFSSGHSFKKFIEVQQQMWWYHTRLKATHNYQSTPLLWVLDIRPVWFYVNYQTKVTGNIYALGNPVIFWLGLTILPLFSYEAIIRRSWKRLMILFCYLIFWLPWLFSPRIMFMYHYLPSIPFLSILLAWGLVDLQKSFRINNRIALSLLAVFLISFIFFYPLWTGLVIPKNIINYWFWLTTWK